tara:strand:+ start:21 stop:1340 length:1320 start_codon:yes stop_codon:yes gene_type:complete
MNEYYKNSTNRRTIPIIRIGKVVYNIDPKRAGIIKVNIVGIDKLESDDNLIDCVPLLPKYLSIMPEVGESVFVFQYEDQEGNPTSKFHNKRFWIGPIISQPTRLEYDPAEQSNAILPDGWTQLKDPNIEEGAYGNKEDIVLQGRYNTDIIQKDREIWLRAGKFQEGANNKFNPGLGYIQLKYGGEKLKKEYEQKEIIKLIPPKINTIINVDIITYVTDPNGNGITPLANDLPSSRYKESDVNKTTFTITFTKSALGIIQPPTTLSFNGQSSRDLAVSTAKTFIDTRKGTEWRINSSALDILKEFPNYDEDGKTAVYSITPTEAKETITEVKLVANDEKKSSVINIVADKINLISHIGDNTYELSNPKSLITDDEQEVINNTAQPLVYGNHLLKFLELVKEYINEHVHAYHGIPADNGSVKLNVLRFDLNKILNKNINTN